MATTAEHIQSFIKLPKGWCYTRGVPFKQSTVDLALEIEEYARTMQLVTEAFPGENGEILLDIYPHNHPIPALDNIEILIEPTGEIEYGELINDELENERVIVEISQIYTILEEYAEKEFDYGTG